MTRGQGQSPALEGDAHANFRATSPFPRGGRFRNSGRLEPALRSDNQALAAFLPLYPPLKGQSPSRLAPARRVTLPSSGRAHRSGKHAGSFTPRHPAEGALSPSLPSRRERPKVRLWASLRKEVMPMVQLLRAVLANTLGRLLASLISKFLED